MVDIQIATTSSLTTAANTSVPSASSSTVPNAVQVTVANVSQALQDLSHAIQTNATPVTAPVTTSSGTALTLSTALGDITVTLPQLTAAEQQSLIQQLTNLAQSQRPLTLALQPGSPPTQAMLLIPASAATPPATNAAATPQIPVMPSVPLAAGETLPALVLPSATSPMPALNVASMLLPAQAQQAPGNAAQPLPLTAMPVPVAATPDEIPAASLPQNVNAPVQTGNAVTAQPSPLPGAAAPAPSPQQAVVATPVETLPEPQSPAPPLAPAMASPLTQSTLPVAAQTSAPAFQPTTASPTLASLLQPGNEVSLHVDAVLPASANATAWQASLPPLASNQIAATITGTGTDGQLILKAGDTTLFVKAQVSASPGSTVIVTVDAARPMPLVTLPSTDPVNFPALPQALAALAQIDPQALQQMIAMRIPQPAESLPGAMLFLLGAFKQGNLRDWLGGDATESLLRAGKMDLVESLSRDLSGAGQSVQDSIVGEWKSFPIPLYAQQQFQALTLYVHNDRGGRDNRESAGAPGTSKVRFLIDMQLSRLGAMQLDGFVQPKKLDMILRSEHLLPPGVPNELRSAYINAISAVGYAGSLNFQVGRNYWMTMQRQAPPGIVT